MDSRQNPSKPVRTRQMNSDGDGFPSEPVRTRQMNSDGDGFPSEPVRTCQNPSEPVRTRQMNSDGDGFPSEPVRLSMMTDRRILISSCATGTRSMIYSCQCLYNAAGVAPPTHAHMHCRCVFRYLLCAPLVPFHAPQAEQAPHRLTHVTTHACIQIATTFACLI